MVDGGVDLVKMIPMGHEVGAEPPRSPPHLPFYFFLFAFLSLYILHYLCFPLPSTLNTFSSVSLFINRDFELVWIFFSTFKPAHFINESPKEFIEGKYGSTIVHKLGRSWN